MSKDSGPWALADRIRQAEDAKGLTIRAAAAWVGLPLATYYEASRGDTVPRPKTVAKLVLLLPKPERRGF